MSSALLFGSAVDNGLNVLLKENDLQKGIEAFEKSWRFQYINDKLTYLPEAENIVYAERDYDADLLDNEDRKKYEELLSKFNLSSSNAIIDYSHLKNLKKERGFKNLSSEEKILYNYINWLSFRHKGIIMINSYYKEIVKKINKVVTIQGKISLENDIGDSVIGYLDLVVDWEDGKRYLLDHKTSTKEYENDSAMKSQQLVLYYHSEKEALKLNGVGFIVLYKQLIKNKKKICSVCSYDGSEGLARSCDNEIDGKRCKGTWNISINPRANIQVILNEVPEMAENLVIETFDRTNEGIKNGVFAPNLASCGSKGSAFQCGYYEYCWLGSEEEIVRK